MSCLDIAGAFHSSKTNSACVEKKSISCCVRLLLDNNSARLTYVVHAEPNLYIIVCPYKLHADSVLCFHNRTKISIIHDGASTLFKYVFHVF